MTSTEAESDSQDLPERTISRSENVQTGHKTGHKRLLVAVVVVLALAGAGVSGILLLGNPGPRDAAPTTEVPRTIVGLGALLPRDEVRTVAMPSGAGDARIATLHVSEGETVEAGQRLATLDTRTLREAERDQAAAALAVRQATVSQVRIATGAAIAEAEAALARAQAAARNAEREYARGAELRERNVISQATLDERTAARDQAVEDVREAKARLSRYPASRVEDQADVLVAEREADAARADLARAERDLSMTEIRAPSDGTVLEIHARAGETAGNDGVVRMADLTRMKAEVEVYQTLIGAVEPGAAVTLRADTLSAPLSGTVERIGLEVRRQTRVGESPAANTDARVVDVTVALDPQSAEIAARFTNLQVVAEIQK